MNICLEVQCYECGETAYMYMFTSNTSRKRAVDLDEIIDSGEFYCPTCEEVTVLSADKEVLGK